MSLSNIFSVELVNVKGVFESYLIGAKSIEYLYIIEDIYSFGISGKIKFRDSVGLTEFGPLTGDEIVRITYGNADATDDKTNYRTIDMLIYSIDSIEKVSPATEIHGGFVELTLVDEYYFKFHMNYISKSWSNAYIHDIILDILKYVDISKSDFDRFVGTKERLVHFDTNNRTPAECIQWLVNRASDNSGNPAFLFYRGSSDKDLSFKFNFVPFDTLLSNTKMMKPEGQGAYYTKLENVDYVNYIKDYRVKPIDKNSLSMLLKGFVVGYDIKRKKLIKREYTYEDGLKHNTILGEYTIFPEDMTDNVSIPMVINDGYHDENILDNLWKTMWIKEYNMQNTVTVEIVGHEERHAGGLIRIFWPSMDDKEGANKQMDGKFLVKSITHYFSGIDTYPWLQSMVLIKNGFRDSNNLEMIKAVRKNG